MKKTVSSVRWLLTAAMLLFSIAIFAQTAPSNLKGTALKEWLKTNYYQGKHHKLGYTSARRYMYNFIDNKNGKIECVYSGVDKDWAYGGTGTNPSPINCEHTVPQSFFGKAEPMKSDIHHLFPTYANWNSTRSNHPFGNISNSQVEKWMINTHDQSYAPTSNQGAYSKYGHGKFEPRDKHKGNVARAIFYFYTMYPNNAGDISRVADPQTLYQWHLQDPVDQDERSRNAKVEQYQGDRNPYIDHPEYVALAWGFSAINGGEQPEEPTVVELADACTVAGDYTYDEWIADVSFAGREFHSAANSYKDYTSNPINVQAGESYRLELTPGFEYYAYREYWSVWIDFENNGDFSDDGDLVYQSSGSYDPVSTYITIPANAQGKMRMRVAMQYGSAPQACQDPEYGEVEDFCLNIGTAKSAVANVEEKAALEAYIYPNPATSSLTIDNIHTGDMLRVMDLSGKVHIQTPSAAVQHQLDVNDLPKGVYILQVIGEKNSQSLKFSK